MFLFIGIPVSVAHKDSGSWKQMSDFCVIGSMFASGFANFLLKSKIT